MYLPSARPMPSRVASPRVASPRPSLSPSRLDAKQRPNMAEAVSALARIVGNEPFAGRTRLTCAEWHSPVAPSFAVAIPVRNEIDLLPRSLGALETALEQVRGRAGERGLAIFTVNGSRDASADCIRDWASETGHSCILIECEFAPEISNAAHARRLALDCAAALVPSGALLTSDADTHVAPGWITRLLDELAGGRDLVCEDVRLDERELSRLPAMVSRVGEAERAYFNACEKLWRMWTQGSVGAFAYRASGASMAVRTSAYRAIGGLPLPTIGEDAALCAAILRHGYRAVQLDDAGTRTSARLESRAEGGCAGALAARARAMNPACDDRLLPVEELRRSAARRLGCGLPTHRRTPPMCLAEVERELVKAERLLAATETRDA